MADEKKMIIERRKHDSSIRVPQGYEIHIVIRPYMPDNDGDDGESEVGFREAIRRHTGCHDDGDIA